MAPQVGTGAARHVHEPFPAAVAGSAHAAHLAPSAGMLTAHVVATVVLAVLLSRAEAALWHVVRALLPRLPGAVLPVVLPPRLPAHDDAPVLVGLVPLPLGGRAPPVAFS